jgi:hypothetical protein
MQEKATVVPFPAPVDYQALAVEKLAAELKSFSGDRYGSAVKDFVASTLTHFCQQDKRFAEVVYGTKRTLSDCCTEIMKGCGTHVSDIDVYRGAVRSYFPNADISFTMSITINGDAPSAEEMARVPKKKPETEKPHKGAPRKPKENHSTAEKPVTEKKADAKPKKEPEKKPETIQLSLF